MRYEMLTYNSLHFTNCFFILIIMDSFVNVFTAPDDTRSSERVVIRIGTCG